MWKIISTFTILCLDEIYFSTVIFTTGEIFTACDYAATCTWNTISISVSLYLILKSPFLENYFKENFKRHNIKDINVTVKFHLNSKKQANKKLFPVIRNLFKIIV